VTETELNVVIASYAMAGAALIIGYLAAVSVMLLRRIAEDLDEIRIRSAHEDESLQKLAENLGRRRGRRDTVTQQFR